MRVRHPLGTNKAGILPDNLATIAGIWGTVSAQGDLNYLNMVHMNVDGTNPDGLTEVEIEGRRQAMRTIEAVKGFMPGCEQAKLRNFGMTFGIRDTRKIDAIYNLTAGDVCGEVRFADSIGMFPEFIDGYGLLIIPTTGRYFHLPYRALLPKTGPRNLLVASRSIGGDKVSHAAVRIMMCCAVGGHGAGVAAAVSIKTKRDFHALDIAQVGAELRRQGARVS